MKNEMILANGVKIEVGEQGVNVIGTDGEVIRFDNNGKLLRKVESFMQYFDFMGHEQQRIAKEWAETTEGETDEERKFIELTKESAAEIKEDYYIANIEPSIDENGRIYYKAGGVVARVISPLGWKEKAREFAPECESDLASKYQLVLWYAYRIAMGYWTIEYVCDDSSSEGNYYNSPNSAGECEVSGARSVGGARDGVGNTRKIVTDVENGFVQFGGYWRSDGCKAPVADVRLRDHQAINNYYGSGVVVLKKSN